MKRPLITALVAAVGALLVPAAQAGTANANFGVGLNVLQGGSCSFNSVTGINASYDPGSPNPTDTSSGVGITCTSGTPWALSFDQGLHADAGSSCTAPLRRAANGSSFVSYGLYSNIARTQPLGCVAANDAQGTGTGSNQNAIVFFRAPAGQSPTATGNHADTVVLTLTF